MALFVKCIICGQQIRTMAFMGTGVCSEMCRKERDNDHAPATGMVTQTVKPKMIPAEPLPKNGKFK